MKRAVYLLSLSGYALLVACGAGDDNSSFAPLAAEPYGGPVAAYSVQLVDPEPLAGLYLKAIDPETGEEVPGREPVLLGHHGTWALSPDGTTMALAWTPPGDDSGPAQLSLLDLERWETRELGFEALTSKLFWSPAGERIYVTTWRRCEASECWDPSSKLITIDAETGDVLSEEELPFSSYATRLSPDGATLYLFGGGWVDPRVEPEGRSPRLVAYDIARGEVRDELELPDVLWGQRQEVDDSGQTGYASYIPGTALSPAGDKYYIAHPDSDRITVVDLATMRVERSGDIHHATSVMNRILSLFAGTAQAKGGPQSSKGLAISPDGELLYVTGHLTRYVEDETTGETTVESANYGLRVVDARSLEIVAEDVPADPTDTEWVEMYRGVFPDPRGLYLYALMGAELRIMEPKTLEVLRETIAPFYEFLVGPAPQAAVSGR